MANFVASYLVDSARGLYLQTHFLELGLSPGLLNWKLEMSSACKT